MEYGLKYQSDFYNIYGTLVSVQISKAGYGGDVKQVRTQSVEIEVNYEDENTPIIGTGAKINIINEGAFNSLEDLLTSTEKQFRCDIIYNTFLVFSGYSICDLNEQQFLPWSNITLQFTDYLHRMENDLLDCLSAVGESTCIMEMLQEMIQKIGLTGSLFVNNTLFETTMANDANSTFLEQTYGQNNMFYSDTISYDNTYDALNKILKSFGVHLYYSIRSQIILERVDDVTRNGDWVKFEDIWDSAIATGVATPSLKQEYNKQDGDFKYTESSQVIEYDSGLKKLILQLKDKQFDTFILNDFKIPMLTTAESFPSAGSLALRTWYIHTENTIFRIGNSFRGIGKYIYWTHPEDSTIMTSGLYYCFNFTFNLPENYVDNPDFVEKVTTELTIDFKQSGMRDLSNIKTIITGFLLRVNDGPRAGSYLGEMKDPQGNIFWGLSDTYSEDIIIKNEFDVSVNGNTDNVWSINEAINLTDPVMVQIIPGSDGWHQLPSLWDQLGQPTKISFIISFFPSLAESKNYSWWWEPNNIIGDIQAGITQQSILNKITYYINADFVKTETLDMEFFDLANENFANGLEMLSDSEGEENVKTQLWSNYSHPTSALLMDIFARYKFGNYCKTLHKLKGKIMHDGYLKPFSILTDDNLVINGKVLKLLLHGYSWDLNNGTYDIEAVEYTEETLLPDEESDSSATPPFVTWWVEFVPPMLSWYWSVVNTLTFVVTTNMVNWIIGSTSYYEHFTVVVYDPTDTFVMTENFVSGCVVHVTPKSTNTTPDTIYGHIYIATVANEVLDDGEMLIWQEYDMSVAPILHGLVGVGETFTLDTFDGDLTKTSDMYVTFGWTPTGHGLPNDYTLYMVVSRVSDAVIVGRGLYPRNTDGLYRTTQISFYAGVNPEGIYGAMAGTEYNITFTTNPV